MSSALEAEIGPFARYLRAENKSDNTVTIYTGAIRKFARWLSDHRPDVETWEDVEPANIQDWIITILETRSDGYANNLYRSIQQFFKWWSEWTDEPNPMAKLRPPAVPEKDVPVLRKEQLGALLKNCSGKTFVDLRDLAMILLFMDTGIRRAEMAGIKVEDLDLDMREVKVHGKGRRDRVVSYGRKTAVVLDKYLRIRGKQKLKDNPALWLAEKNRGALTRWGIYEMLKRRAEAVGIEELYPHLLRHTWAHFKKQQISEEELMRLAGWRSRQMLDRYAASTASERAREAGRRTALSDQI
ncbi:tyrosine-type recombinase/integrase [Nonomuraea sp. NPDC050202]|jgi:integrase/recombinase XerD|uniref:tyrosine-type recombinase/integrase n=1 Tax=Nonomuraea sp. NPDC050202 TaxID=3155035 RepID=UPI0033C9D955